MLLLLVGYLVDRFTYKIKDTTTIMDLGKGMV